MLLAVMVVDMSEGLRGVGFYVKIVVCRGMVQMAAEDSSGFIGFLAPSTRGHGSHR